MKKIIIMLITLVLLVPFAMGFVVGPYSDDTATVTIPQTVGEGVMPITVRVSNLGSYGIQLKYDSNIVEVTNIESTDLPVYLTKYYEDTVEFMGLKPSSPNGEFTIYVTLEGVRAGYCDIKLRALFYDVNGAFMPVVETSTVYVDGISSSSFGKLSFIKRVKIQLNNLKSMYLTKHK